MKNLIVVDTQGVIVAGHGRSIVLSDKRLEGYDK